MAEREPITLGEYLYEVRRKRGWSLREAAKHVQLTHSRLDEIEKGRDARTGKHFVPSYINVIRLAKGYGLPPDDLLRRAGYEPGIELERLEWEVIGGFRRLSPERQQRLLQVLGQLRDEEDRHDEEDAGEHPPRQET